MQNENPGKSSTPQSVPEPAADLFGRYSPLRLFAVMLASIFFAEIIAMGVVYIIPSVPYILTTLIDAGIMLILIFPILYALSFRPLLQHIEKLQRAEAEVEAERSRLRSILDTMPDGIYIIDQQYDVEYINPVIEREFGLVAGQKCYSYFHNEDMPCPWCKNAMVFEGRSAHWEWSASRNGKTYDVYDAPLANSDGTFSKLKIMHDITERRRAEGQIREMALFPALNPNAVLQVDADGRIRKSNPAAIGIGLNADAQLFELIPDLRVLDLPAFIAAGFTQHIHESQFGGRVLQWTIQGAPDLGLVFLYSQDITERKRSEERVRLLSSAVEQTADTVVVTDCDGRIEYVNPAFENLTGYSKEDAIGQTPRLLKSGVHDEQFYKELWDTALAGQVFHGEITNRKKNGDLFHEVKTITPLRNEQGTITHFVATGKDITERKQAEEQLRRAYDDLEVRVQERTEELRIANSELEEEINVRRRMEDALRLSEMELRNAQEVAGIGNWKWNLETREITWSDEMYRIFGIDKQSYTGRLGDVIANVVHPEDLHLVLPSNAQSLAEKKPIEYRIILPDKSIRHIWAKSGEAILDDRGKPLFLTGIAQDITERKQTDEQLARINQKLNEILVSIQDDFYVLDRDWNFAYASRLFTAKIGKEPEDFVGKNIWTMFPKHVGSVLEENFRAAMEKREVRRFEIGGKYTSAWYRMTVFPSAEGITIIGTDITDRKKAEEQLRYQAALLSNVNDAIVASDAQYRITAWNAAAEALYGWTADEVIGHNGVEIVRTEWAGKNPDEMRRAIAETGKWRGEATQTRKDGTRFFVEVSSIVLRDSSGGVAGYISVNRDITERKRAEEALRASEEKYRNLFENMTEEVHFWHIERDESGCIKTWRLVDANPPTLRTWGRTSVDEIRGKTTDEILGPGATEHYLPVVQKIITENASHSYDDYFPNLDKYFRFTSVPFGEYFITTGADITSIKKAEQALQQSEAMLRAVLDQMPSGVTVRDARTGELILSNARSREILGTLVDTADQFEQYRGLYPDGRPYRSEEWPVFRSIATGEIVDSEEIVCERSNGNRITISISSSPIHDSQGRIVSGVGVFNDITERKRIEERLQQLNRTLRALSNTNQAMIRAMSESQYLEDVCRIVVEDCGHSMVWIGYTLDDEGKSVQPIASAGFEAGYLETLNISWADTERGHGPTGIAIRTGKTSRCNNMLTDPQFAPWREQAIKRGYASSLVLPLMGEDKAFGAISIYSREPDSFSKEEEALLTELAGDLAYGIQAIRLREAHDLMEAELRLAHDRLEIRVRERTEELAAANRELSREIAERREIERQLRIQTAAMDAAANGMIITDPNGIILWTNPALTQISGYEENDLIGKSTKIFNSGKHGPDFYHRMWETILAGKVWHGETTNRRKDGGLYVEEQTITPVHNEDGVLSHFIAIKQDVTERNLIYSQLEDSNRDLRKLTASERQQRFLAEGLVEASAALNRSLELHAVLDRIFEQTRRTIPYLIADVALIQDGVANIVQRWGENLRELGTIPENENLRLEDFPIWEQILETKSAVMIPDTRLDHRWNSDFNTAWIRCYIGAPLIYGEQVIGIINLGSDEANAFHPDMVKTLAAFAAPAAVAIQNARLYEDEQQNRKVAEILSAASVALSQTLDIEMVMETILDYMQFILPVNVAFVILSEGDERYRVRAVRSEGDDRLQYDALRDRTIDILSEPVISPFFTKLESTFIPDSRQMANWSPPFELTSMNCWLGIPLASIGKALGMVVIANATPLSFTEYQIGLADAVVRQAVVALQNAWLFEQVRSGRERLQQLSRHLVEVQENERKYIARELHDETSQSLTSLKMGLQVIEQKADGHADILEQVKNLKHLADETLESLHHLAVNLRPASLDHLGLADALTGLIESTRQRSGLTARFKMMGSIHETALTEEIEASIYRIVQESLTNVVRHAQASYVDVILEWHDDRIMIVIEDDGVGLDLQKARETGHLGLVGMQERAEMLGGKLVVDSTPQSGTTLVVEIPYANTNTHSR